MDIAAIRSVSELKSSTSGVFNKGEIEQGSKNQAFEALFQSALSMVKETNAYSKQAEEAEMSYALGLTTNTHEVQIAQQKANVSLQYTVAVRNAVMDAYKEIMQLQF